MRRFERRRLARLQRQLAIVGVSFAIGALTTGALLWESRETGAEAVMAAHEDGHGPGWLREASAEIAALTSGDPAAARDPAPAHDPAEPRGVERPGERGTAPAAVATTGSVAHGEAVEALRDRDLEIPVKGIDDDDLRDTYADSRGSRAHEAIDIMAPRGTEVRAVEAGQIQKLFTSKAGGVTIYQFDRSATFCYYYAHLDRYAPGLEEGQEVKRGQVIGYVGTTGNASPNAPHLHFAIFRLTAERQWWKGEPVNPYAVLK